VHLLHRLYGVDAPAYISAVMLIDIMVMTSVSCSILLLMTDSAV